MASRTWRNVVPEDHAPIAAVIDDWWGGRQMADMLPRLFFDHFRDTSFVAVSADGEIAAFIIAFASPHDRSVGYVHFIGVRPDLRGSGLGQAAYERCWAAMRERGCTEVRAVTSPANVASLAFHQAMGFTLSPIMLAYDGPGEDRVLMSREIPGR